MAETTVTVRAKNKVSGQTSTAVTRSFTHGTTLGWSIGGGTSAGLQQQTAAYGPPAVVRVFSPPGSGIKPWGTGLLAEIPKGSILVYSIKDWDAATWPQRIRDWMTSRPVTMTTPYYFCLDHEPEQGPTKGDPDPVAYKKEWSELAAAVRTHPRRKEMRLLPIFTEYYARRNASWWNDFGIVASWSDVDAIGFDVYDLSYSTYRTEVDRFAIPLQHARRPEVKKPLIIAEWGIDRKTSIDPDGTLAAQEIRQSMEYLRKQSDAPYVAWWHDSENALFDQPNETVEFKRQIALNP